MAGKNNHEFRCKRVKQSFPGRDRPCLVNLTQSKVVFSLIQINAIADDNADVEMDFANTKLLDVDPVS